MRSILMTIFIALVIPSFGQSKVDYLDCLKLIFADDAFQPAFVSDATRRGNIIITSDNTSVRRNQNKLGEIRRSLTQNDFRSFSQRVDVFPKQVLESREIPGDALMELSANGNESKITFNFRCQVIEQKLVYSWAYNLVKVEDEWQITTYRCRKNGSEFGK